MDVSFDLLLLLLLLLLMLLDEDLEDILILGRTRVVVPVVGVVSEP